MARGWCVGGIKRVLGWYVRRTWVVRGGRVVTGASVVRRWCEGGT